MSTVVYRYGLRPPTVNVPIVREQMRLAHQYRNVLVSISRGQREAQRAVIEVVPEVASATELAHAATEALLTAKKRVAKQHSDTRSRSECSEDAAQALTDAKAAWKLAFQVLEDARKAAQKLPAVRAEFERLNELGHRLLLSAREYQSPHWSTYGFVEKAHQQSLRLVLGPDKSIDLPLWSGLQPRDPHFVRWSEATRMVAAYNNGGPDADVAKWVTIGPMTDCPPPAPPSFPSAARAAKYVTLRLAIATDEKRKKIWAEWPMILDRPLPPDAKISSVRVRAVREGPSERWEALVTVSTEIQREKCGEGRVAIDIGWRAIGDTLRVAYAICVAQEYQEDLRLSADLISSLTKAASLHGIRADLYNRAQSALAWWIATSTEVPSWMPSVAELLAWRAPDRLLRLCFQWRENRFAGDEEVFDLLDGWVPEYVSRPWRGHSEPWRRQDRHLAEWEAAQSRKALARRKDMYRCFAAKIARRFDTVVFEKFDLRKVAAVPDVDEDDDQGTQAARSQRQLAAVSELRTCIKEAFVARGGRVLVVEAADSTHECPACGAYTEFDAKASLFWTCSRCGLRWDQDHSAAFVLDARGERLDAEKQKAPPVVEKRQNSWQKIKARKAARSS